uniref:Uncharacterized protein n=1 Tax=Caenorhabditis japonica TaxID=281687 RepID=A0A8R1EHS6_CAEJA
MEALLQKGYFNKKAHGPSADLQCQCAVEETESSGDVERTTIGFSMKSIRSNSWFSEIKVPLTRFLGIVRPSYPQLNFQLFLM